MLRGRFSAHRGSLCIAVAVLMPVPTALSGQPLPEVLAPTETWTTTTAGPQTQSVPVVPVPADQPPVIIDAPASRDGHDGAQARDHRKKRAVIKTSQHQRIQAISANTSYDVPLAALNAYRTAASRVASSYPGCHLSWGVVAAIGQVESGHGRFGGASVLANGMTVPKIVGPELNGRGPVAAIHDTDNGVFDGDRTWDRAVGPMQFIPSTWANIGVDGDGDGRRNPSDFDDAALSTAIYLCSGGGDFTSLAQARGAVMRYNHSEEYVDLVLEIANAYDSGVVDVVANDPAPPKPHRTRPHRPAHRPAHRPSQQPSPRPQQPRPAPRPGPSPDPSPDPKPDPQPKPEPPPKPVVHMYEGVWTWVSPTSGKVATTPVKLPLPAAVAATLTGDLDNDGGYDGSLAKELQGLTGGSVSVVTTDGVVTKFTVQSPPPPTTPSSPSPASPSAATTPASTPATKPTTPVAP